MKRHPMGGIVLAVSVMGGLLVATGTPAASHGMAAAPVTQLPARAAHRPALLSAMPREAPRQALRLTLAPADVAQYQLGAVTAALSRPLNDGRITFTQARPGPAVALYSCTPTRGRCGMEWSVKTPDAVTISARWSGDRRYKPAVVARTIMVRRARYTSLGTWQGRRVGPLTRVAPALARVSLSRGARAGRLLDFRSSDPAYACLNGRAVAVYTAPGRFPDEYVVRNRGTGSHCQPGLWLYPQAVTVPSARAIVGAAGALFIVHGVFPQPQPYSPSVLFMVHGTVRASGAVIVWSASALTLRAPPRLLTRTYTIIIGWHDRLTGATIQSRAGPLVFRVNNAVLPIIIAKTTHVLPASTMQSLSRPAHGVIVGTRQSLTLTFNTVTPGLRALKPGDVLVSGATPATPDGLLRKVTAVSIQGSRVVVQTAPARLQDAIAQGVIEVRGTLTSQGTLQPHVRGAAPRPRASFCRDVSYTPFSDSAGDAITDKAHVCLALDFDLRIAVGFFQPVRTTFTVKARESVDLQVQGNTTRTLKWEKEFPFPFVHLPLIYVQAGIVPFVFVPDLTLKTGLDGNFSAGFSAGVTQRLDLSATVRCQNTDCSISHSATPSLQADPVTVSADADLSGYFGPHLTIRLAGVTGPDVGLEGYLGAKANIADDPWWTITGGARVLAGITFDIDLLNLHKSKSWTLLDLHKVLLQANGPFFTPTVPPPAGGAPPPPPPLTVAPTPVPVPPSPTPTDTPLPACLKTELVALAPASGAPGSTISVTFVDDCDPGTVSGSVTFDGALLTSFTSTDQGWTGTITIPAGAVAGDHTIAVTDDDFSSQRATFTVIGPPPTPTAPDTATPTDTPTPTATPTDTALASPSATPTDTPVAMGTATTTPVIPTATPTSTGTITPTDTITPTGAITVTAVGTIEPQGITAYNYGTHILVDQSGSTLYALRSETIDLNQYIGSSVQVYGFLVPGYPVNGGPPYLDVTAVTAAQAAVCCGAMSRLARAAPPPAGRSTRGAGPRDLVSRASVSHGNAIHGPGTRVAFTWHNNVYLMNADGSNRRAVTADGTASGPVSYPWYQWSPDGKYLLVVRGDMRNEDILLYGRDGSLLRTLIMGAPNVAEEGYFYPSWAKDGDQVAYIASLTLTSSSTHMTVDRLDTQGRHALLWRAAVNGPAMPGPDCSIGDADISLHVRETGTIDAPTLEWSIARHSAVFGTNQGLYIADLRTGTAHPFVHTVFGNTLSEGALSPNGRLAAADYIGGETRVVLTSLHHGAGIKAVAPGELPVWSRDGRYLYFVRASRRVACLSRSATARLKCLCQPTRVRFGGPTRMERISSSCSRRMPMPWVRYIPRPTAVR